MPKAPSGGGGGTATITALAVKPGAGTYYNLTVSTLHTYAVGTGRFIVHNCPDPNVAQNGAQRQAARPNGTAGALHVANSETGQELKPPSYYQGSDNLNPGQTYGANHAETQAANDAQGWFRYQANRGATLPPN